KARSAGFLVRIEPRSNSVTRTIRLDEEYVRRIVIVGSTIVAEERHDQTMVLEAIDARTGRVLARTGHRWPFEVDAIVAWRNELWADTPDGAHQIDPRTLDAVGMPVRAACCFLASSGVGIWLETGTHHTLALFEPWNRRMRTFRHIDGGAIAAAAGPGALWLLDFDGTLQKIALVRRS